MRKLLKITAIVVIGLVVLGGGTLGVLYWLYPFEFVEYVRSITNPYQKTEVVTSQEPPASSPEQPSMGAGAVGFGISPSGVAPFSLMSALLAKAPSRPLPKSIMVETQLPFTPNEMRRVLIYLPKGYLPDDKELRYPTLYMLHGTPGTEIDWPQKGQVIASLDEAIEKKTIPPVIAVFPNGNGKVQDDSEYINTPDGLEPNEDFITKTVVGHIDKTYPTRAESKYRAIGGLSEGGYGAVNLTLRNQDIFEYALSLSGYGKVYPGSHLKALIQDDPKTNHDNSPLAYIPELKTKTAKLLIVTGEQDSLFKENQDMYNLLKKQGFTTEFQEYPGSHTWKFWSAHFKDALVWWGKNMAK